MRNDLKTLALAALLGGSLVAVTGCAKDGGTKPDAKPAATDGDKKDGDQKDAAPADGEKKDADKGAEPKEGDGDKKDGETKGG